MSRSQKQALLQRLDEARAGLEALLPGIDPSKQIYPGWTISQLLAHMTGWDDANIASLRAHVGGRTPATPADRGIDAYNAQTVSTRQDLDLDHVAKEWRLTRQILRTVVEQMPEDKFQEPLVIPWGGKASVTELIEVFVEHEHEHTADVRTWLKHPEKALEKQGG